MKKVAVVLMLNALAALLITIVLENRFVSHAARSSKATPAPVSGAPHPPPIVSISVCSEDGTDGAGSCSSGQDTFQPVLAPLRATCSNPLPNGRCSINHFGGLDTLADEHSTVFSPGQLGGNSNYLFFVASRTNLNLDSSGLVVLSGGTGPDANGQWTLHFARSYGHYGPPITTTTGYGQVFLSPFNHRLCPQAPNNDVTKQDQTFDLNYANPGSVVIDPTNPANTGPGNLLMIYEGTTRCIGLSGVDNVLANNSFYSSVAIATSNDHGHTWPSYRYNLNPDGTPQNPVPNQSQSTGPEEPVGALWPNVCIGNNCSPTPTPPPTYGRYQVLRTLKSVGDVMANSATSNGLAHQIGDSEPSAFVDDASANPAQYVYELHNYVRGDAVLGNPDAHGFLMMARAQLSGGTDPLTFEKWNGQTFSESGIGGLEIPILPNGSPSNCLGGIGNGQITQQASISYVEETQQYLLTFVCNSPNDPANPTKYPGPGAAWFYSTSYDVSDPTQWSVPQEIDGSWSAFDSISPNCPDYNGWYPTYMSLDRKSGHLSITGYAFYMHGCLGESTAGGGRQYSSRAFKITTTDTTPPVSMATVSGPLGSDGWYTGPTTVNFTATDDLSGVVKTEYSLDNGTTWTTGTSVSLKANAIYDILYRSTDLDGNVETPRSIIVKLDSKPPSTTVTTKLHTLGGVPINLEVDLNALDNLSGVAKTEYSLDRGSTWKTGNVLFLCGGTRTIRYFSTDVAGNVEKQKSITVNTPPCQ